jgi:hypothetical protein
VQVKDISLRYVGSPYQTSLSEAGQTKYLYELTCNKVSNAQWEWYESERWPIDVGKKYFKVMLFKYEFLLFLNGTTTFRQVASAIRLLSLLDRGTELSYPLEGEKNPLQTP